MKISELLWNGLALYGGYKVATWLLEGGPRAMVGELGLTYGPSGGMSPVGVAPRVIYTTPKDKRIGNWNATPKIRPVTAMIVRDVTSSGVRY